jgi:deoxyuridine 5'-triphosphate nucleotidohydrolase
MFKDNSQLITKAHLTDGGHDIHLLIEETTDIDLDLMTLLIDVYGTTEDLEENQINDTDFIQPSVFIDGKSATLTDLINLYQNSSIEFIALAPSCHKSLTGLKIFGEFENSKLVNTGIYLDLPINYTNNDKLVSAGLILPRSGLASKCGITVSNSPGLIDQGYKGEIKVDLLNTKSAFNIFTNKAKIAQLVIMEVVSNPFNLSFDATKQRVSNGFGSTGV